MKTAEEKVIRMCLQYLTSLREDVRELLRTYEQITEEDMDLRIGCNRLEKLTEDQILYAVGCLYAIVIEPPKSCWTCEIEKQAHD